MRPTPWIVCLGAVLLVLPTPAAAQPRGSSHAFLAACGKYDNAADFHELPGAIDDLRRFRAVLLESGYDPANIVFLHEKQSDRRFLPEKKKILKQLDLLLSRLQPEDSILVALNGHGLHFRSEAVGYFLPIDAEFKDRTTMLAMSGPGGLFALLEKCKAGRKLLLVNACRNDPLARGAFAARKVQIDDEDNEEIPRGVAALYSCRPGQRSWSYLKGKNAHRSLFYHHLTETWRGAYADGKPVTLEDVFREVQVRTAKDAAEIGDKQHPQARRRYDGVWVVQPAGAVSAQAALKRLGAVAGALRLEDGKVRFTPGEAAASAGTFPAVRLKVWDDDRLARLSSAALPAGLDASDTAIRDTALKGLPRFGRLRGLNLAYTHVTDAGVAHLAGLRELRVLSLYNTDVTDAGLKHLTGLENLQALDVGYTGVTDEGMKHLAAYIHLKSLRLCGLKHLTDRGVARLAGLKELRTLDLSRVGLTDEGLQALLGLKELHTLDLGHTDVTDAGLLRLTGLKSLRTLRLAGKQISDRGAARLREALPELKIEK